MPNDAKLGLVIGVVIVLALGALYHRTEPATNLVRSRSDSSAVNAVSSGGSPYGLRRLTSANSEPSLEGPGMPEGENNEPRQ